MRDGTTRMHEGFGPLTFLVHWIVLCAAGEHAGLETGPYELDVWRITGRLMAVWGENWEGDI